jgi:hypothetical protein
MGAEGSGARATSGASWASRASRASWASRAVATVGVLGGLGVVGAVSAAGIRSYRSRYKVKIVREKSCVGVSNSVQKAVDLMRIKDNGVVLVTVLAKTVENCLIAPGGLISVNPRNDRIVDKIVKGLNDVLTGGTRGRFVEMLDYLTETYGELFSAARKAAVAAHDGEERPPHRPVHLFFSPLIGGSYHSGYALDARAVLAALDRIFDRSNPGGTCPAHFGLTMCIQNNMGDTDPAFLRTAMAVAAAGRVCVYDRRKDHGSVVLFAHSQPLSACAKAGVIGGMSPATKMGRMVGLMVISDARQPGMGLFIRDASGQFVVENNTSNWEASSENRALHAWMFGEFRTSPEGLNDRIEHMNDLFESTIKYMWGLVKPEPEQARTDDRKHRESNSKSRPTIQGGDYSEYLKLDKSFFGDAFVVREAMIELLNKSVEPATLVFVIGPTYFENRFVHPKVNPTGKIKQNSTNYKKRLQECVKTAVRAGLDAMIREKVTQALVMPIPYAEDGGVGLVNGILVEEVEYEYLDGDTATPTRAKTKRGNFFESVLLVPEEAKHAPQTFGAMSARRFV